MQNTKLKLVADYGRRAKELSVYGSLPEGFYLIEDATVTLENGFTSIVANAKWHPKEKEIKQIGYPITVNLSALRYGKSIGPKEFNFTEAKGVTIHVKSCTIKEYEREGIVKQRPEIEWGIISFAEDKITD